MGRTRKTPREATNLTIISIHYSEHDLKEGNINIVDFTVALQNRNRDINKRELCKEDVTGQYALLLLKVFHPDEPRYLELISQAESPVYHNYWAKSLDKNQPVQQNRKFDSTGFRIATRKLFVANEQRYPQCIVMEQKDLGLIIVPGIALRAMHQLSFKKVVRSTLEANAEIPLLHLYMRPLCVAIIRRIYHFEDLANQNKKLEEMDAWDKDVADLLESYRLSHRNLQSHSTPDTSSYLQQQAEPQSIASAYKIDPKDSRKRAAEPASKQEQETDADGFQGLGHAKREKGSEESEAEDTARSTKRQKREVVEAGRWQGFEKELDSAGASPLAAPTAYRFADTGLPLRFKS